MVMQTTFSPLSFGKSFMKIRSAIPRKVVWYFCGGQKKQKTYAFAPPSRERGCVNYGIHCNLGKDWDLWQVTLGSGSPQLGGCLLVIITTCTVRVILFSVMSVCLSDNTITPEPKFSGHQSYGWKGRQVGNGYIVVHGWWFNGADILVIK